MARTICREVTIVLLSAALAGCGGSDQPGGDSSPECGAPTDCAAAHGSPPCGDWACTGGVCVVEMPGCTDADHDGYGAGPSCTCSGLDCDDADDTVHDTAARSCYSGPAGTDGVGSCRAGSQSCAAGAWTSCEGEVVPGAEACNGIDDDCDGVPDDGFGTFTCGLGWCMTVVDACVGGVVSACIGGSPATSDGPSCNGVDDDCDGVIDEDCVSCIPVTPTGNDAIADGTFSLPFRTVQPAIDWAAAHAGPKLVCVASGAACGATATYTLGAGATLTMVDGVSVVGRYESTGWTRCANSTTVLAPGTGAGVTFPSGVGSPTALAGFQIDRFAATTTAAVTVDGAHGVVLSDLAILNAPAATRSYAVNVVNGGDALIARGRYDAGAGTAESIGVRVVGARVAIRGVCGGLDTGGRCDDLCVGLPSIRGRTSAGAGVSHAVLLQDAAGSTVEQSALCSAGGDWGSAVRIAGAADGILLRGNRMTVTGGVLAAHGVWAEDCGGAAPWIVDNHTISADGSSGSTRTAAVFAAGSCHPIVDGNGSIVGGGESGASNAAGVHCAFAGGSGSRCTIDRNGAIRGSQTGVPPSAVGIRCEDGSCARISRNVVTGGQATTTFGLQLAATDARIEANEIRGGCSANAVGVRAAGSAARLENNRIFGFTAADCVSTLPAVQTSRGLHVLASDAGGELDVHSNFIDGAGGPYACASAGIVLDVGALPPTGGSGVFRNDIIRAGQCSSARFNVLELSATADPRIFEHDDLDPSGSPTALYVDEGATSLFTAAAVDALSDMTASGTLSADPLFTNYPSNLRLQVGSPCIGAGTTAGAPAVDADGNPRGAPPDVGPYER